MEKRGRKPNSPVDVHRAIAWYHCVEHAAGVENATQLGKIFQADESRIWHKHRKGTPPGPTWLRLAEQRFPGTSKIFEIGPDDSMLWDAMEQGDVTQLTRIACRPSPRCRKASGELSSWLAVYINKLDQMTAGKYDDPVSPWVWLAGLLALYRLITEHRLLEDDIEQGAVAFVLLHRFYHDPVMQNQLDVYGINVQLAKFFQDIELSRLKEDVELKSEIESMVKYADDPMTAYLYDPSKFVDHIIMTAPEEDRRRITQCKFLLYESTGDSWLPNIDFLPKGMSTLQLLKVMIQVRAGILPKEALGLVGLGNEVKLKDFCV